jgi:SNF2 family DNA or RNA helicase
MKMEPLTDYQRDLAKFILGTAGAACWARVGAGKTRATLTALETMNLKAGWRTLVVAPKHVALNVWQQEAEKWGFNLKVVVLHGPKKAERLREPAHVFVVNYDGLPWLAKQKWPGFDVLVLDESSKCRNTDTNRFKLLRDHFRPKAKRVIALSGTPKPNGEINLFGQYRLIDGGERLGKYVTHFRNQYCYQTGFGGYAWELLPGASELIRRKVQDITIVIDGEVGIPNPDVFDIEVPLPDGAARIYDAVEKKFFSLLGSNEVTAVNAAARVTKLRQIASGAVYVDDADAFKETDGSAKYGSGRDGKWEEIHDARIDALDAFVEEADGPVLLFANYNHEFERIKKEFPEAVVFSWLSDKARTEALDEWNRGKIDLLLAHPASAGHGLNLQHGGHELVWFSLLYDLELYEQAIGRLARKGQTRRVRVTRFLAPGTIDEVMRDRLASKGKGQKAFLDAIKKYAALKSGGRPTEK